MVAMRTGRRQVMAATEVLVLAAEFIASVRNQSPTALWLAAAPWEGIQGWRARACLPGRRGVAGPLGGLTLLAARALSFSKIRFWLFQRATPIPLPPLT